MKIIYTFCDVQQKMNSKYYSSWKHFYLKIELEFLYENQKSSFVLFMVIELLNFDCN